MGLNWKYPFSPFTYPITYTVEFWYFKSLCNRDTVSNRTYQNFRDKRLVRPGSRCPNLQRSQTISYKTKFSQRDNIYLVYLKCNITYQNIRGETKVRLIFIPEMLKGTVMQIWKSPYIFKFTSYSPVKFAFFLKSRLIFNIFFCFYVCKQIFRKLYGYITRKLLGLKMRNF